MDHTGLHTQQRKTNKEKKRITTRTRNNTLDHRKKYINKEAKT